MTDTDKVKVRYVGPGDDNRTLSVTKEEAEALEARGSFKRVAPRVTKKKEDRDG